MKKVITAVLALMLGVNTYAEKEKIIQSSINEVTVFLQGAQIHRKARFTADKGISKIVIEGATQTFNKNSIQVKGKGEFVILEVSHKLFYPTPDVIPVTSEIPDRVLKEIKLLKDSIADIDWELTLLSSDIQTYTLEKNMLTTSGVMKGQTVNDSIAALKDAMTYMREKLLEINHLLLKKQKMQGDNTAARSRMAARLYTLQNYNANVASQRPTKSMSPIQQIIVTVSADEASSGYLYVSYMVPNAGWSPSYDLRADDIKSPVKLTYKANVYQNTGKDWDNVDMTLSTINPNRSNNKPTLAPWYVNFYQPIQYQTRTGAPQPAMADDAYDLDEVASEKDSKFKVSASAKKYESNLPEAQHLSNFTNMTETMAMVEFELKLKQTIPSDGQSHLMAVKSESINSTFEHFIVPKLDKDAFLIAHLTGWEELNLLPAVANIYYDGTYVGQTRINPSVMSDTLDLALGRDRGIYVTRKKTDDEEKIKAIGSEKTKTVTYEIAIKNYKSGEINLTIEDQVPVSATEDIKVDILEKSKADYDEKKGLLTWKLNIGAKESEKFTFKYSMKYDKDKTLAAY